MAPLLGSRPRQPGTRPRLPSAPWPPSALRRDCVPVPGAPRRPGRRGRRTRSEWSSTRAWTQTAAPGVGVEQRDPSEGLSWSEVLHCIRAERRAFSANPPPRAAQLGRRRRTSGASKGTAAERPRPVRESVCPTLPPTPLGDPRKRRKL